jgi:adenylosuccinate synthase
MEMKVITGVFSMTCWLLCGMCFGDEGKGATTDALVRRYGADLIIRYNGGSQCAHNVITPEGKHFTFCQFGSGSTVPNVKTYLSRFMLVDPSTMMVEAEEHAKGGLYNLMRRTYVDKNAFVVTRYHKAINRILEKSRKDSRHGSTGMGIGATREMSLSWPDRVLTVGDLQNRQKMKEKLYFIRTRARERVKNVPVQSKSPECLYNEHEVLKDDHLFNWYLDRYTAWTREVNIVDEPPRVRTGIVFEGAQGMLLDETFGFQPHTTWTDITFTNAITILKEIGYSSPIYKIGVLRSYYTRHGDGPFPSQDQAMMLTMKEDHNKWEEFTGDFRFGNFDIPLAIKALNDIKGVDYLAINHMDVAAKWASVPIRLSKKCNVIVPYQHFTSVVEEVLNVPIKITGHGPRFTDRSFKEDICQSSL